MQITLDIDDITAPLLAALDDEGSPEGTIYRLIDHAAQGVYRPGAWERPWLCQAFGEDFLDQLETGEPYGRTDMDSLFQRPKKTSLTPYFPLRTHPDSAAHSCQQRSNQLFLPCRLRSICWNHETR